MKISVAQINYHIGNFEGTLDKMLHAIQEAKDAGSDIVCFSELATVGYPARDFLEFDDFIKSAENTIARLCEASKDIAIVVGSPTRNPKPEGKDLFNSAYFLAEGEIKFVQHKTLLPTYDVFDEYRYFEPAKEWDIVTYKGKKIALTVCEDIWDVGTDNPLYNLNPMDKMMEFGPDFMINVSASPFTYDKAADRLKVIKANIDRYKVPMFYINHCGAQTELLFDGGSVVMAADGSFIEMPYFENCTQHFELEKIPTNSVFELFV